MQDGGADGAREIETEGEGSGPADVSAEHLAALLAIAANRVSRDASSFYRTHFGIGLVELRLLFALGREDALNPNALARRSDLDKGAVSRSARVLEDLGWIEIARTGKAGPRLLLSLTPLGREKYRMLHLLASDREAQLLDRFGAAEMEQLKALLHRLIACTGRDED